MRKINILQNSLITKKNKLNVMIRANYDDVMAANGQPLNDKRGGQSTLDRWGRRITAIQNQKTSIAKTEQAIEKQTLKDSRALKNSKLLKSMPEVLIDLIDKKVISQWQRHPNRFFITGVDSGRLIYKNSKIFYLYMDKVPANQYHIFRDVFNFISHIIN